MATISDPVTVADLTADVRILLDEQGVNDSSLADGGFTSTETDDDELDTIIEKYIVPARNFVLGGCDIGLLVNDYEVITNDSGTSPSGVTDITIGSFTAKQITVPAGNVLRLLSVQSSSWDRMVSDFIQMDSKDYLLLQDAVTTGTPKTPKVAVGYKDSSTYVVELYSFTSSGAGTATYSIRYVKQFALDDLQNDIKVYSEVLIAAIKYYIAGLVCQTLGDSRADNFIQLATINMGVASANQKSV